MIFGDLNCSRLVFRRIVANASATSRFGITIGASGGSFDRVMNPDAGPTRTDTRPSSSEHWTSSTPSFPTIFQRSISMISLGDFGAERGGGAVTPPIYPGLPCAPTGFIDRAIL